MHIEIHLHTRKLKSNVRSNRKKKLRFVDHIEPTHYKHFTISIYSSELISIICKRRSICAPSISFACVWANFHVLYRHVRMLIRTVNQYRASYFSVQKNNRQFILFMENLVSCSIANNCLTMRSPLPITAIGVVCVASATLCSTIKNMYSSYSNRIR